MSKLFIEILQTELELLESWTLEGGYGPTICHYCESANERKINEKSVSIEIFTVCVSKSYNSSGQFIGCGNRYPSRK